MKKGVVPDLVTRVGEVFPSRFVPYDFQRDIILRASENPTTLLKMDVGTGKTIVSWFMALGATLGTDICQILILSPPTLVRQWYEFVKEFENIPSVCAYQGSPAERARMDLTESIIIMGYQIFLRDFEKIYFQMRNRHIYVIADECSLREVKSQTYRKMRKLLYNADTTRQLNDRLGDTTDPDKPFVLLNATPVSNPSQTYGYIKMLTPLVIMTKAQFEYNHVKKKDRYNRPVAFQNMELLEDAFKLRRFDANADELLSLPPVTYIPIRYDLEPKHLKAYELLARQSVKDFPEYAAKNKKEIDNLFMRLQQMVTNPEMFGYDFVPPYLELLDERLEELGPDEKVIIFGHFVATNEKILKHLGSKAVGFWGRFSPAQKLKNEDAFKGDANRFVAHCKSGGVGLNLQYARHEIFVEIPPDPPTFKQAVGRIHRDGQQRKQFVAIFLASGTIQERIYFNLIAKDKLLAEVIGDKKSLENFLM